MRVAVVGGTGFLGRHVSRALVLAGHRVTALSRSKPATPQDGVEHRAFDAVTGTPSHALGGVDAVVNLVGIKRESGQSFEQAHVGVVLALARAMAAAGIDRLVHVSVADPRPSPSEPYMDTKVRGETAVRESGLRFTILRPGVVYGEGDDVVRNLAAGIRHLPLFPAPGGGRAPIQFVDVQDVAAAVVASLDPERAALAEGATLDVVGPDRLDMRVALARTAEAVGLSAVPVPAPVPLLRPAAALMERALADPPLTRSQLGMLGRGMVGDVTHTRALLGRDPSPMSVARLREIDISGSDRPLFGLSLRPVWSRRHLADLAPLRDRAPTLAWFVPLAVGLLLATVLVSHDVWVRMLLANAVLLPLAVVGLRLPLGELLKPTPERVVWGVGTGLALYPAGWAVLAAMDPLWPDLRALLEELYRWIARPEAWTYLALPFVVFVEDVAWRVGIAFPLAARGRPELAILVSGLAFGAAHLNVAHPVLALAALLCGCFWAFVALRTRSLLAPFLSHLLWDVLVAWVAPYGG